MDMCMEAGNVADQKSAGWTRWRKTVWRWEWTS